MESHNSILNEYQSSNRRRRDHMWMRFRFFRSEFDEIEKRESSETGILLKKKTKIEQMLNLTVRERPSAFSVMEK